MIKNTSLDCGPSYMNAANEQMKKYMYGLNTAVNAADGLHVYI